MQAEKFPNSRSYININIYTKVWKKAKDMTSKHIRGKGKGETQNMEM